MSRGRFEEIRFGNRKFHLLLDQYKGSGSFGEVYDAIEILPAEVKNKSKSINKSDIVS